MSKDYADPMIKKTSALTIGRLAKQAGVGIDTVRFYERAGLLPKPQRTPSGYRSYASDDVSRLRFIRRSKALGFSLDEVAELLVLSSGKGSKAEVRAIAERRLTDLEDRIRHLSTVRDTLAHYAKGCSGHGPVSSCPIIAAVLSDENNSEQ